MKKLGVMIVGPGWVAGEHVKGYCRNPNAEIKSIVGMIPEDRARAEDYMKKYGFKAEYSDDLEKALKNDEVDVVSICTINFLHYEQALSAMQAGKHVLVEKPLCFTLEEAKDLKKISLEKKVKTHVGHVGRWYPAVAGLKKFIDSGGIGDVFYGESDYWHEIKGAWKVKVKTGGSSLLMGGCHSVDMVRHLIGEDKEIKEVVAFTNKARRRTDFEYDPTIAALFKFENGAVGKVATSLECNMPYVFHIQMCGTKGTIRNNGIYSEMFPQSKEFMKLTSMYMDDWDVAQHPFPEEIAYFVDCVIKDRESECCFARAYKTYEAIFGAELSARENCIVKLPLT